MNCTYTYLLFKHLIGYIFSETGQGAAAVAAIQCVRLFFTAAGPWYCPDKVASNRGQPKSCFGSSIPNPMSSSLPTEVG